MKKMFVLLMLFTTVTVYSQVRLGSTFMEVKEEYGKPYFSPQTGVFDDDILYYAFQTPYAKIMNFFDINNICNVVYIEPRNKEYLLWFKEKYSRDYKLVSDTLWKARIDKIFVNISLNYPDSTKYTSANGYEPYFLWTYDERYN